MPGSSQPTLPLTSEGLCRHESRTSLVHPQPLRAEKEQPTMLDLVLNTVEKHETVPTGSLGQTRPGWSLIMLHSVWSSWRQKMRRSLHGQCTWLIHMLLFQGLVNVHSYFKAWLMYYLFQGMVNVHRYSKAWFMLLLPGMMKILWYNGVKQYYWWIKRIHNNPWGYEGKKNDVKKLACA